MERNQVEMEGKNYSINPTALMHLKRLEPHSSNTAWLIQTNMILVTWNDPVSLHSSILISQEQQTVKSMDTHKLLIMLLCLSNVLV